MLKNNTPLTPAEVRLYKRRARVSGLIRIFLEALGVAFLLVVILTFDNL
jgi:hypothetical protein